MKYGGKYWNIKKYLPYQRNFNFIDSERSIGKTYTTQGFFLERSINKREEFIYFVRTQDEIKRGVFTDAFNKVLIAEFNEYEFKFKGRDLFYVPEENVGIPLGHCIALSEANKNKRINIPNVYWGMFDEYIVDTKGTKEYIDGWNEPNLLLKIYHTIDREQDRLCMFFLSNSIQFYNPYHLHKAFNIPKTEKGKIWTSENVLYHWTEATKELKEEKKNSKFLRMIDGTEYGEYAVEGNFINDSETHIDKRSAGAVYRFAVYAQSRLFGVWFDYRNQTVFIDTKANLNMGRKYSFDLYCNDPEAYIVKGKEFNSMKWLGLMFKNRQVKFVNMEVKNILLEYLWRLV